MILVLKKSVLANGGQVNGSWQTQPTDSDLAVTIVRSAFQIHGADTLT